MTEENASSEPTQLAVSTGIGPAMDEAGLPARPPPKTPGYVVLAGYLVCAAVSLGIVVRDIRYRVPSDAVLIVGVVVGFLPASLTSALDRFEKRLGQSTRIPVYILAVVGLLSGIFLLLQFSARHNLGPGT